MKKEKNFNLHETWHSNGEKKTSHNNRIAKKKIPSKKWKIEKWWNRKKNNFHFHFALTTAMFYFFFPTAEWRMKLWSSSCWIPRIFVFNSMMVATAKERNSRSKRIEVNFSNLNSFNQKKARKYNQKKWFCCCCFV